MAADNEFTDFVDQFDRSDRSLNLDGGWTVTGELNAALEILDTYVTQTDILGQAIAYQQTTLMLRKAQEASAFVSSNEEANAQVGIGVQAPTPFPHWGLAAILKYEAAGVRTLSIVEDDGTATFPDGFTVLTSVVVTTQTLKISSSDLNVRQDLKFSITPKRGGTFLEAWLNPNPLDLPDVSFFLNKDQLGLFFPFMFFSQGIAPMSLQVEEFRVRDIESQFAIRERPDLYTVAQVLEQSRLRYKAERNQGVSDLNDDLGIQFVRQAQSSIFHELGDMNYFIFRAERMTLNDVGSPQTNVVVMPLRMDRILSIRRDEGNVEHGVGFEMLERQVDGRLQIRVSPETADGSSYRVRYVMRWADIDTDADFVAIPKDHVEVLVLGVCLRYLELDNAPATEAKLESKYNRELLLLKRTCNKQARMRKDRLYGMGGQRTRSRYESDVIDHRGY